MKNLELLLRQQEEPINVIYVSSYIPRQCGIATYTKDLTNGINLLNARSLAEIMVIDRPEEHLEYPWEAKFKITRDDLSSYLAAANYINHSNADLVVLEHEFGLYGGDAGEYIIPFVEALKKPLITTCHTVVNEQGNHYSAVLKRIANRSDALIVMMENVAQKLHSLYNVPRSKIVVIPHGVPDFPFNQTEKYKKKRKLQDRIVLGNINLLADNKGVEYALEAVAIIAKKYPNVLYTVIGQTHPEILRKEGEQYRNSLKAKVKELGIQENVRFVNKYLTLKEVIEWLKSIDMYITPYLDPEQITSGALAYAIGAGKACISTPYVYANEVLADGRGIFVPFRDSKAIAEAVFSLVENPEQKKDIEKRAYRYGRLMTWPTVAQTHLNLFRNVLHKRTRAKQEKVSGATRVRM